MKICNYGSSYVCSGRSFTDPLKFFRDFAEENPDYCNVVYLQGFYHGHLKYTCKITLVHGRVETVGPSPQSYYDAEYNMQYKELKALLTKEKLYENS